MYVSNSINDIYRHLLNDVKINGDQVGNTVELQNVAFQLTNIEDNIPTSRKNYSLKYLLGELYWYFSGSNSLSVISQYSNFWTKISDDGITSNSAYGYIMQHKFNFNQITKMIELLRDDKNSRRAVININVPNEFVIETADEPCTIAIQFLIREGKLNATVIMRSNDLWFGLPYDIPFFTELQKYIANELGVEYGTYTHFVTSMHIYDRNMNDINESIKNYDEGNYNVFKINPSDLRRNIDSVLLYTSMSPDFPERIVQYALDNKIIEELTNED